MMDEVPPTPTTPAPVPEPISDIQRLNELRLKVLQGVEIPPEDYLEVLVLVRKIRRQKGDPIVKVEKKSKMDAAALLSGLGAPKTNNI